MGRTTGSPEETLLLAEGLAKVLPLEITLALHGDLGAGKTTFVKGLARAWKIDGVITSPTFNLYHVFHGERTLVHLDAYRLDQPGQVENLLIEDFLRPPCCLAVEWPDHVADWLPSESWHLDLSIREPGRHHLKLRPQRT